MAFSETDERFMRAALEEARLALETADVPIGAVAVLNDTIIGRGRNRREADHDPTAHAEMLAIREAAHFIGHWRLEAVTLYCTLEPCAMCAGAMVLARLPRLVFAASDPKGGMAGSLLNLLDYPTLNHRVSHERGLLEAEAADLIRQFFRRLRAEGQK